MATGSIKAELRPGFSCVTDAILDDCTCMCGEASLFSSKVETTVCDVILSTQLGVSAVVNNEDDDDSSE